MAPSLRYGAASVISNSSDDEELARNIIRYFLRNRFVTDTVEGLVRFRLMEHRVELDLEATIRALQLLVERGLLREVESTAAGPLFSLDPGKAAEAERFVEGEERN